jgi:hypothetical protein
MAGERLGGGAGGRVVDHDDPPDPLAVEGVDELPQMGAGVKVDDHHRDSRHRPTLS